MGTGSAVSTRSRAEASSPNPRRGGQAGNPGLFGIRIDAATGSAPAPVAVRPSTQVSQVRPAANSLSFGQRRARPRFLMHRPVASVSRPIADEFDGYGLACPSTPAMQAAARASDQRQQLDWHEAVALVTSALND